MSDRHRPEVPTVLPPASGAATRGAGVRECAAAPARVVGRVALAPPPLPAAPGEAIVAAWDATRRVAVLRPQEPARASDGLTVPAAALPALLADLAVLHGRVLNDCSAAAEPRQPARRSSGQWRNP